MVQTPTPHPVSLCCPSIAKPHRFQTKIKEPLSHQHNFNLLWPHTLPQYQNKSSWRIIFWLIKTLIAYISMICSSITDSQNVLPLHSQTQGSLLIYLFSVYFLQHCLNILPKVHFLFLFNFRYFHNIPFLSFLFYPKSQILSQHSIISTLGMNNLLKVPQVYCQQVIVVD